MQSFFRPFIFLLIFTTWSVMAAGLQDLLGRTTENNFLPVEEAFRLEGYCTDKEAVLRFTVAPGYYLYRHRLQFQAVDSNTRLGNPVLPEGITRFDPYQQVELETYPDNVEIRLPIKTHETLPEIAVTFQGCADAGLCYPPHTTRLILIHENTPTSATNIATTTAPPAITTETRPNRFLASFMNGNSLWSLVTLFFLGGLALAFTPCVLPMIPILSTVVIGKTGNRSRIILLTVCYVLSMSITFALAGMLMGHFGASLNLQARLQSGWILVPFALLFAVLALSMFGLFELQLPARLRNRLLEADQSTGKQRGGTCLGAMLMGIFATLLVSPCVSAPLAGVLIYISSTSDMVLGGTALFSLGLGMGTPLLLLGVGGSALLPKSGTWMNSIRTFFGVLMLGVTIWLLERIIPAPLTLLLWGSLLIGSAVYLGALDFNQRKGWNAFQQTIGILLLIYGVSLFVGGIRGNTDPLRPLASETVLSSTGITPTNPAHSRFQTIDTLNELEAAKVQAVLDKQPLLLDLYADWCVACKVIEREILGNPDITKRLQAFSAIRMDITRNTPEHIQLLNQYQLFGPPAFLLFDRNGQELTSLRLQGEITIEEMAALLDQALSSS